ncbi:2-acyl-glycerophospho-ethanolamine acyltransferase [Candidatus Aerophobetes bacterium]|uniref:2-acyl-glycerophospho-ethanolamine acyltransferase n=1 Tax=Aerophobetes bacterium TaxID=2030807 RepID=A0A2A4X1P7_UNCAE|nr:MAG: 2-acyl-glycerophospho-ethanolamine acyltransferase [Candidatus Aerophobetes bacterium]
MKRFVCFLIGVILRLCLKLRYRITTVGMDDALDKLGNRGVLFLPNHPAEIDPIIIITLLYKKFTPNPLVTEKYYYEGGSRGFMDLVGAMPLPDFDKSSNQWKKNQYAKAMKKVGDSLTHGGQFLIYPSGHLKHEGTEHLGASSMVHKLLKDRTNVDVVLIRSTGLWGSSFSRAITGKSPNFWSVLGRGVIALLKGGIFFLPKRNVVIEFEKVSSRNLLKQDRLGFNAYLENWYNQYPAINARGRLDESGDRNVEEELKLLPYAPFSKKLLETTEPKRRDENLDSSQIPEKNRKAIDLELIKLSGMQAKQIEPSASLAKDLGLDSLDMASIVAFLDFKFNVHDVEVEHLNTVGDVYVLSMSEDRANNVVEPIATHNKWPTEQNRPDPLFCEGDNIAEVFLRGTDRMKGFIAGGDENSGILSYSRLKVVIILLSKEIEKLPGKHVGILLPASITSYLLVLSCYFAKKVPCVLNWTVGKRNMEHAKRVAGFESILTSRKFLEKAKTLELGACEDDLILLEDMKANFSLIDKLNALRLSKWSAERLIEKFDLKKIDSESTAVLLFTSGTESHPKAVPLSHSNILRTEKAALSRIDLLSSDLMLGNLPPFHSFGFSVTGMMPLLSGLKVFYSPDPTDWQKTMQLCQSYPVTMLCMAPSFYKNLFSNAPASTFETVRLFVTGAERAPNEFFEKVKTFGEGKLAIEGYGITECSPIVTMNAEGKQEHGVGKAVSGVELMIVHPETDEVLKEGEEGEIYIHGPGVFSGYLSHPDFPIESPFAHIDGKIWYKSGDLGRLTDKKHLILSGRLKRFVKIGGEMVSFAAVEQEINDLAKKQRWYDEDESEVRFVVGARGEQEDKPSIVVVTSVENVDKVDLNKALREAGFSNIIRIADVIFTDEIPMTGTGKVALKKVSDIINEKSEVQAS